jgi:nucleotide-binding universal stress UspA family protein
MKTGGMKMAGETDGVAYKLILVAVDGSQSSLRAAGHAAMLARLTGARLKVIYVVDTHLTFQLGAYQQMAMETLEQDGAQAVAEAIGVAKEAGAGDVDGEVMSGSPRTVITDWAKENEASLIVVGSHGYSRLAYILIGSVADYVVHYAHCPVMVVRG